MGDHGKLGITLLIELLIFKVSSINYDIEITLDINLLLPKCLVNYWIFEDLGRQRR